MANREKVVIMGAAGRDFHNFNVYYRNNTKYEVIAFTATQIPNIEERIYPPKLSGSLYPEGIPIYSEKALKQLIKNNSVDSVVFAYSDVTHEYVMSKASMVTSLGANFILLSTNNTMLKANIPVIAVCAVRTGCGKSQTSRKIAQILKDMGKKVVLVRHPMPYGNLNKQVVQRFSTYRDFELHECTIEEREEYEPIVENGMIVYAGIDYELILKEVEKEADIIIWDGGNNDTPFFCPDVHITVFDPHRAGHELKYYPGTTNMLMSDIAIINKVATAKESQIQEIKENIRKNVGSAKIVMAESDVIVDNYRRIKNKKVLVVEDGPTLTHGEMSFGAGLLAAIKYEAEQVIDPRNSAVGSVKKVYNKYKHIGKVLPAIGYSKQQIRDLETTINNSDCDLVLFATPIDLTCIVDLIKPALRVRYEYKDYGSNRLEDVLKQKINWRD